MYENNFTGSGYETYVTFLNLTGTDSVNNYQIIRIQRDGQILEMTLTTGERLKYEITGDPEETYRGVIKALHSNQTELNSRYKLRAIEE